MTVSILSNTMLTEIGYILVSQFLEVGIHFYSPAVFGPVPVEWVPKRLALSNVPAVCCLPVPEGSFFHSFIPLACEECGDSLPFSGASSILPYHILFPATLLRQLCFHPPSLRPAVYFLVYLLVLLFPNSYTVLFWGFYFLPFSVRVQTIVIYVTLLSLLLWVFWPLHKFLC